MKHLNRPDKSVLWPLQAALCALAAGASRHANTAASSVYYFSDI